MKQPKAKCMFFSLISAIRVVFAEPKFARSLISKINRNSQVYRVALSVAVRAPRVTNHFVPTLAKKDYSQYHRNHLFIEVELQNPS